ncbi:2-oxo acid dehydrogenase subunit E2 [Blastococcus saxobsidens]|uniref:Dihydrolipoamide acetyltransferase component of pyruvate dehydrogenase complex n=1 Tax=Blastococcus saxobsidens TaxID=138336 RepID=A0A6L9W182_9ACTN|nr:2-oxo acid dehydrogenase subunit E2 [Blastococcus saxobsidens]
MGQTMETGIVTVWRRQQGQDFSLGDVLYEVETDKMVSEVEAKQDGVLLRILAPAGTDLDVGTPLAVIAEAGASVSDADVDAFLSSQPAGAVEVGEDGEPVDVPPPVPAAPAPAADVPQPAPDAPRPAGTSVAEPGPAARDQEEAPPLPPPSSGPPTAADPSAATTAAGSVPAEGSAPPLGSGDGRVRAVPKARKVARELGVDLSRVTGSGNRGVIRVRDVREAAQRSGGQAAEPAAAPAPAGRSTGPARITERIPVRGVTRAMAGAMTRSWQEIPQFVQQVSLDAGALVARYKRLKYEGAGVTYTDLLVSATALTAREVPEVNASFTGEEILRYGDVNVSIAVATDRGLLVPVLRNAQDLRIEEVAAGVKALAARAREGRLTAEDTKDGTITVSNLGAFGIDTGTPIINAPQSAIVFVGSLSDQAVVREGQIVIRPILNVSVAYDHRVVDGMTGARFTSALKARLEAGG